MMMTQWWSCVVRNLFFLSWISKTHGFHLPVDIIIITTTTTTTSTSAIIQQCTTTLGVGTTCFAALTIALDRPRGGCSVNTRSIVQVQDSTIAGQGLFATKPIAAGTILGTYPGVCTPLTPHLNKLESYPQCANYIWRFSDNQYVIDPTNRFGELEEMTYGGSYQTAWMFETIPLLRYGLARDTWLCRINEPPLGRTTNVRMKENIKDRTVTISLIRNVSAGEEFLVDYGPRYDRSGYGPKITLQ